ncbi:MAG: ABC transporter ATP-binding protein [bacterium]|nr:ABC transporter ATP-binding protein [bacterium]
METKQLQVSDLVKIYDGKKVVDGISFDVYPGEMIGFLGANGAGKSTSIRVMTGLEKRDSGDVLYCGKKIEEDYRSYQQEIGVVPQDIALYNDLSAYDNVKFFCSLYGYRKKELEQRVEEALQFVGLWEHRKQSPKKYSGGMKRRLNIACAIMHSPKLLIMDEPTVGIDPQSRNHIMETIKELNRRGTTIIYVSHYMEEIEALCDRMILMDHGTILTDCSKEDLKATYQEQNLLTLEDIFLHITGKQLRDEVESA